MCLIKRTEEFFKTFGPAFDGGTPPCFECGASVKQIGGYIHWDALANTFALLCIPCSEKAIQKDSQYRGTEFAFAQKAQ